MRILILVRDGIVVFDEDGRAIGKSPSAGWKAVSQVAVSRVLTAFPCLTLPPFILSQLERLKLFQRNPRMLIPVNLGITSLLKLCFDSYLRRTYYSFFDDSASLRYCVVPTVWFGVCR
jgi:hypothetical protein